MKTELYDPQDPSIFTYTGERIFLKHPVMADIKIIDIAHHLGYQSRYGGALALFYSVAQHSVLGSRMLTNPLEALCFLMHDASEAYIQDITHPLKDIIGNVYRPIEDKFMQVICDGYKLPWPMPQIVHEVDARMYLTEIYNFRNGDSRIETSLEPYDIEIDPWSPEQAEANFLTQFLRLNLLVHCGKEELDE